MGLKESHQTCIRVSSFRNNCLLFSLPFVILHNMVSSSFDFVQITESRVRLNQRDWKRFLCRWWSMTPSKTTGDRMNQEEFRMNQSTANFRVRDNREEWLREEDTIITRCSVSHEKWAAPATHTTQQFSWKYSQVLLCPRHQVCTWGETWVVVSRQQVIKSIILCSERRLQMLLKRKLYD